MGIGIIKTATSRRASPGQAVLYELEVVNTGAIELTGIVVSDPLLGVKKPRWPACNRTSA
ncbi:DUF7507 domain-containing protein [Cohnella sp. 56]|uniref:DUF7507 domain-containing protein n=1 Tax=Cohnella sp. 56 TaxID=3113722 RepID=UPI0030E7CD10